MDSSKLRAVVSEAIADLDNLKQRFLDLLSELDGDATYVPRQGRWTKPMLEQLWVAVCHLSGIRSLFGVTHAYADKSVTFTQVLADSRLTGQQQRNEHARMSRIAADLFGEKRWPIENWQGPPTAASGKAEMLYRMDGTIARWWNEICEQDDE